MSLWHNHGEIPVDTCMCRGVQTNPRANPSSTSLAQVNCIHPISSSCFAAGLLQLQQLSTLQKKSISTISASSEAKIIPSESPAWPPQKGGGVCVLGQIQSVYRLCFDLPAVISWSQQRQDIQIVLIAELGFCHQDHPSSSRSITRWSQQNGRL